MPAIISYRSAVPCLRVSRSKPNHVLHAPLDLVVHEGQVPLVQ